MNWYVEVKSYVGIVDVLVMLFVMVDKGGCLVVCMVLFKCFDESGFVFYMNLISLKVYDLEENLWVVLCFYWVLLSC